MRSSLLPACRLFLGLACCAAGAFLPASLPAAPPLAVQQEEQGETPNLARELLGRLRGRGGDSNLRVNVLKESFKPVVSPLRNSVVRVLVENKQVALGTVVSGDGHVITKASEAAEGELVCQLADGRKLPAQLLGIQSKHDLALLKIEAEALAPVVWVEELPSVGSWLATPGVEEEPVSIGVVSVQPREIRAPSGLLGVQLDDAAEGALVQQIVPDSGAEAAGLQAGDRVLELNGRKIASREALIAGIRQFQPGDRVRLLVRRGEEELTIVATLGSPMRGARGDRREFQNSLGGSLSIRRAGFPSVLQHDSVLQPNECGGPVCDLDGRVVGVNIARAGRVNSYAIPAPVVRQVLAELRAEGTAARPSNEELKMQQLARRIESLEGELMQTQGDLSDAASAADDAAATLDAARRRAEELSGQINELRKQLNSARRQQEELLRE